MLLRDILRDSRKSYIYTKGCHGNKASRFFASLNSLIARAVVFGHISPWGNATVSPLLGFVPELQKFSVVLQDQSDPKAFFNLGHLSCVSGIFLSGDFHIFENFKLLFKVNFVDEMKAGQD